MRITRKIIVTFGAGNVSLYWQQRSWRLLSWSLCLNPLQWRWVWSTTNCTKVRCLGPFFMVIVDVDPRKSLP